MRNSVGHMHMNPLKRGLAASPSDWAWSSYSWYEGRDDGSLKVGPI